MYECNKQYETDFLKNNAEPAPGPCFNGESEDPNYKSNWDSARKYCQKISLVWAVGGDMVNLAILYQLLFYYCIFYYKY